jgi:CRP/FNR family cyclic AMP-dependent transcriptional regulator
MDNQLLLRILREHPFTRDLDPIEVENLAQCARLCRLEPGDYLWHECERADSVFLISSGQLALEVTVPFDACWRIETLGSGQVVGLLWPTVRQRWNLDARAISSLRALGLDSQCLRETCERHPSLGREVIKRYTGAIAQRLEATQRNLRRMIGVDE